MHSPQLQQEKMPLNFAQQIAAACQTAHGLMRLHIQAERVRGHICVHMEHWQQTDMMSCRLSFGDFRSSRG